jgi:hypothetical protein
MKTSKRDVSTAEAAAYLDISIEDIKQLEKQELLRAVRRHGTTSYFLFDDIAHLKSNKSPSISQEADLIKIQAQQKTASSISVMRKIFLFLGVGVLLCIVVVFLITVLFILFPIQTASWLGYANRF